MSLAGRIGPHELASRLGAGGLGEVFRARATRFNRDVAIKVLPEGFTDNKERVARPEREAQRLAQFRVHGQAAGAVERNAGRFLIHARVRKGKTQPLSAVLDWNAGRQR